MNPRWLRALQQMNQQAGRMQHLLNDLLLLARLETSSRPTDNQPVAVGLLLQSIVSDARALSGARGHLISLDAAPSCSSKVARPNCAVPSPTWYSTP